MHVYAIIKRRFDKEVFSKVETEHPLPFARVIGFDGKHLTAKMFYIDPDTSPMVNGQWFIVSYDSANKQKHQKSHRMQ